MIEGSLTAALLDAMQRNCRSRIREIFFIISILNQFDPNLNKKIQAANMVAAWIISVDIIVLISSLSAQEQHKQGEVKYPLCHSVFS